MTNTYTKLKPEIKAEWLHLLRSGRYDQTQGTLHRTEENVRPGFSEGYCCLGVLCEAILSSSPLGLVVGWGLSPRGALQFGPRAVDPTEPHGTRDESSVPGWIAYAVGLDEEAVGKLIDMNDNREQTFTEIADWIEENL
jgi:hypothetical protein